MESLKSRAKAGDRLTFGVVLFDDHALLDVYGPLELLAATNFAGPTRRTGDGGAAPPLEIVTIAVDGVVDGTTTSDDGGGDGQHRVTPCGGPVTRVDHRLGNDGDDEDNKVPKLDVLLLPGGVGVGRLLSSTVAVERLTKLISNSGSTVVCTVSRGSLLLAGCGVLRGRKATTCKGALHGREVWNAFPDVEWQTGPRWVCCSSSDGEREFYTSAGVSAGMDMMHWILGELFGEEHRSALGDMAEYRANLESTNDQFLPTALDIAIASKHKRKVKVGLVLYDSFEMMDTFGPLEIFAVANRLLGGDAFSLTTFAEARVVKSIGGPAFEVSTVFDVLSEEKEGEMHLDVLLIPGGIGTLREVYNVNGMHAFLSRVVPKSDIVMTVCTGSTILASAGFLDDRRATSNKLAFDLLAQYGPRVRWVEEARWVVDGKFHTSSGVSAGTDLALFVVGVLFDDVDFARLVATAVEYSWNDDPENDPFASTIPPSTFSRRCSIAVQRAALGAIYTVGMRALGRPMYFLAPSLLTFLA